jgi:hypothetical protein
MLMLPPMVGQESRGFALAVELALMNSTLAYDDRLLVLAVRKQLNVQPTQTPEITDPERIGFNLGVRYINALLGTTVLTLLQSVEEGDPL